MTQPAFSPDWLRDTIADLRVKDVRALGHGLWGPTIDLGDGTILKLVRQRAGIGDGLEICGNEACVLAALGGGPLGHLAVPRLVAHATFAAGSPAEVEGYAAWMRLTRVAGAPFSEERLARLPARQRDRFAGSFGESIAVLHQEAAAALADASIPLDDRVQALLKGLAAASPADGGLCAALTATSRGHPGRPSPRLHPRRLPPLQSAGRRGRSDLRCRRFRGGRTRPAGGRLGLPALVSAYRRGRAPQL